MSVEDDHLTLDQITTKLVEILGNSVDGISFLGRGWFSQAYAFSAANHHYILHLNRHIEDFRKDNYAYVNFSDPHLPIPRIVRMGRWAGDLYYAIAVRCPGIKQDKLDGETAYRIAPALFETLTAVYLIDVSGLKGWATFCTTSPI